MQNNTKITKTAKDCKSGRGKLQIHIMYTLHIVHRPGHKIRQDNRATILAELNYKRTDFNLNFKYISQECLMKYHLGGKK